LLTKLKQRVQFWIAAEAKLAHSIGLTPSQVSAVGIGFAILSAFAYWAFAYWKCWFHLFLLTAAPLLLLASGFCDALDGALARLYGASTVFGGFLDSLLDRYADAVVLVGIIAGGLLTEPLWGIVAMIGSMMVSYSRARAEAAGVKMEAVGIAERAERLIILAFASFVNLFWTDGLFWGVVVLALLTNLTVLQRVFHFRKEASKKRETVGVV